MDKNIENYLKNEDIIKIMSAVSWPYKYNIDADEITSLQMDILWECIKKYDPERGSKFTSYLYQQLSFALRSKAKKKKREFASEAIQENTPCNKSQSDMNCYDILDGLPLDVSHIIKQRFVKNMTMNEIGTENGYSRETARRKLIKAVKICKEKNQIEI
jgi:RNA polymerase sigma factor (sigma-70 family)